MPEKLMPYSVTVGGKWILAGEHTVIRGGPAILFPLSAYGLTLQFTPQKMGFALQLEGLLQAQHESMIVSVMTQALSLLKKTSLPSGTLRIRNTIPISAGLGASAALCTALSKWFIHTGYLLPDELIHFARSLEDSFHGESSGADIAVTAMEEGIVFVRGKTPEVFVPSWKPCCYLSYSGTSSSTAECLKKVAKVFQDQPVLAKATDENMKASVAMAKHALSIAPRQGLPLLKEAIEQACSAFAAWGLVNENVNHEMNQLMKEGALAVKPTGSGDGGYILSLWLKPPVSTAKDLIPLF